MDVFQSSRFVIAGTFESTCTMKRYRLKGEHYVNKKAISRFGPNCTLSHDPNCGCGLNNPPAPRAGGRGRGAPFRPATSLGPAPALQHAGLVPAAQGLNLLGSLGLQGLPHATALPTWLPQPPPQGLLPRALPLPVPHYNAGTPRGQAQLRRPPHRS